jgi:hypothetical protein
LDSIKLLELIQTYPGWFKTSVVVWILLGALLVGGLVLLRPTESPSSQPTTVNAPIATAAKAAPLTNITVKEIVDTVRSAPPLQQQDAAKNYIGLDVEWTGYLKSAEPEYKSTQSIRVNLNINKDEVIGYSIWFKIDINTIPELRVLHKESKIKVRGRINSVSVPGISVDLIPEEVIILERAKSYARN